VVRAGLLVVAVLPVVFACSSGRARITHLTAPDPDGCYVEVFEQSHFSGPRDFINGPAKYARLNNLPFGGRWRNRIRSLKVGPAATVTAWAGEDFEAASLRFGPDRHHESLSEAFSARIGSLEIACRRASTP
jgi:hypothetical protein